MTLLGQWKLGNQDAANEFHQRYVEKLLPLIQRNIARRFASRFDADDVAQSVMRTFFGAVADGRRTISEHDDVWKLLQTIALNKTRNLVKFHDAEKRRVGKTTSDSDALELLGEPTEQDADRLAEIVEQTIRSLEPRVAQTMQLICEGMTQDEISIQLAVSTRSVLRYRDKIAEQLKLMTES